MQRPPKKIGLIQFLSREAQQSTFRIWVTFRIRVCPCNGDGVDEEDLDVPVASRKGKRASNCPLRFALGGPGTFGQDAALSTKGGRKGKSKPTVPKVTNPEQPGEEDGSASKRKVGARGGRKAGVKEKASAATSEEVGAKPTKKTTRKKR
ncbi:hypothetical protein V5O48_006117 [Marasmius crinis-equi]|uniref:Uncharacterized protein n=1 Tax=Marasmius crinis-equi TaxID=585013 RepID=A0ABR3FKT6_9AGAR